MAENGMLFHPVVKLPSEYWVFDFTKGVKSDWQCPLDYQIGRYDEHRPGMYTSEIFSGERDLHVGLDIGAPVDTPVFVLQMAWCSAKESIQRTDPMDLP